MRPLARRDNLVIETLPDEIIVYDQTRNAAHCLNSSVNWIWEHCDGSRTIEDIVSKFEHTFGVSNAHTLVSSGIDQLAAANLIGGVPAVETAPVRRMTRRQAVALGASLAPFVTSIVVPTPAAAQSRGVPETNRRPVSLGKPAPKKPKKPKKR